MANQQDKQILFQLLYEACTALMHEKAAAHQRLNAEIDRVRRNTIYSQQQIKDFLYKDGYVEYAKRRKLAERNGL